MNTQRLAKHYSSLDVIQRLKMIHAADRRNDVSERQAILDAAKVRCVVTETGLLEFNLRSMYAVYVVEKLNVAALLWHARARFAVIDNKQTEDGDAKKEATFWAAIEIILECAYSNLRDGWRLFIQQSEIDEERIKLPPIAFDWMLSYLDKFATADPAQNSSGEGESFLETAWTVLRKHAGGKDIDSAQFRSVESIANEWHDYVKDLTESR